MTLSDQKHTVLNAAEDVPSDEQMSARGRVKRLGTFSLILALIGILMPIVPTVVSFILAKRALRISRENLVPVEFEHSAYLGYRISMASGVLWIGLLLYFFR